jgi:diguanylate cyclase (GGDEF)-like protein
VERAPTVLIADDQASSRESSARIVRELGCRVITAADGYEALEKAQAERPDLIILDVVMPRMTGLDACRTLKRTLTEFVPVLLVSSRADVAARIEGLRAGAEDFLAKPWDPDELRARCETLLRTRRLFEEVRRGGSIHISPDEAGQVDRLTGPHRHGHVPMAPRSDEAGQVDRLTGLYGQRYLMQRLEEEFERSTRYNEPIAIVAVDLDEFNAVNERAGRAVGDKLLTECARTLARVCRQVDVITRAGADEFVIVLPNTHFAGSLGFAERAWREVRSTTVEEGTIPVSCEASVGVACYPNREVSNARDLLRFAHAALARAKAEGRGKICLYQHQGYLFQPGT